MGEGGREGEGYILWENRKVVERSAIDLVSISSQEQNSTGRYAGGWVGLGGVMVQPLSFKGHI